MELKFTGKRALVTGAGRGIGREIVRLLVRSNLSVVAVSRTQSNLEQLKLELPNVETVCVDLSNWNETEVKLKPYVDEIDYLINNAAYAECVPIQEITERHLDVHWNLNVKGCVNVTRLTVPGMQRRHFGVIINVSSIAGLTGLAEHLAYGATKGALDNITKVLTLELGSDNIRVLSVNPTVTLTEMALVGWSDPAKRDRMLSKIPLNRFAKPEEVAQTITYLISDQASMLSGISVPIDGGQLGTSSPA